MAATMSMGRAAADLVFNKASNMVCIYCHGTLVHGFSTCCWCKVAIMENEDLNAQASHEHTSVTFPHVDSMAEQSWDPIRHDYDDVGVSIPLGCTVEALHSSLCVPSGSV